MNFDWMHAKPGGIRSWAIFLDVDGTLIDLCSAPDAACVPDGLRETLEQLSQTLGGAIALVSGRSIRDLERMFAPLELAAAGQHGSELRFRGGEVIAMTPPSASLAGVRRVLSRYAEGHPGILIENKERSLAVHYRNAPDLRTPTRRLLEAAVRGSSDLQIIGGRAAFDVTSADANKGNAVAAFMARKPFAGRTPIYIGDDVSDEMGFAEVLRRGGHAIRVGDAAASLAPLRLQTPEAVRVWLAEICEQLTSAEAVGGRVWHA